MLWIFPTLGASEPCSQCYQIVMKLVFLILLVKVELLTELACDASGPAYDILNERLKLQTKGIKLTRWQIGLRLALKAYHVCLSF